MSVPRPDKDESPDGSKKRNETDGKERSGGDDLPRWLEHGKAKARDPDLIQRGL